MPHPARHHTYIATPPPRGHPRAAWDDLRRLPQIRDPPRRHVAGVPAEDARQGLPALRPPRLLELRDPLCQRSDDLWLRRLGPWSPASHLPHTCHLCRECDTVSAAAPMSANRCARCSKVARAEARKRRLCTGASGAHTPPHTATQTPLVPPSCGSTCSCGTPRPSPACRTRSRPDPRPPPRLAEPAAPCLAVGGPGRSTPVPGAERRRRPSGARWQTR